MNAVNWGLVWAAAGALFTRLPGLLQIFLNRRQTPAQRAAAAVVNEATSVDILKDITYELRTELDRNLVSYRARLAECESHGTELQTNLNIARAELRMAHEATGRALSRVNVLETLLIKAGLALPE